MKRLTILGVIVLGACAHGASPEQLKARASFDLDCNAASLTVVEIDDRTRGVKGCDQRATYVEQCKPCANGYVGCECTWVLNADARRTAPAQRAPEPQEAKEEEDEAPVEERL